MRWLAILALALWSASPVADAREFHVFAQVDPKAPISPEACRAMGVDTVWFYCALPVKIGPDGACAWSDEKSRDQVVSVFEHFEGSGISVVPLEMLFYATPPGKD